MRKRLLWIALGVLLAASAAGYLVAKAGRRDAPSFVVQAYQPLSGGSIWLWGSRPQRPFAVFRTESAGRKWSQVSLPANILAGSATGGGPPHPFALRGGDLWIAWIVARTGSNTLWIDRSADAGRNWTVSHQRIPAQVGSVTRLQFVSAKTGWIVAEPALASFGSAGPMLLQTTDGGVTWHLRTLPPGESSIRFDSPTSGWAAAFSGPSPHLAVHLYRTVDGGRTWQRVAGIPLPASIAGRWATARPSVPAFTATQGSLVVAYRRARRRQGVVVAYRSVDGGRRWTIAASWTGREQAACSADGRSGWLLVNRRMYHTVNGGRSWARVGTGGAVARAMASARYLQLRCPGGGIAWLEASGNHGAPSIFTTRDGGVQWSALPLPH